MTVEEIRKELMDNFGYTEEQVCAIKGKTLLAETLEKEKSGKSFFESVEKETTGIVATKEEVGELKDTKVTSVAPPKIGEEGWEEYVLSFLKPNEMDGQYPKAVGLRRIAQLLLGDIVDSGPVQVIGPTTPDAPGRATVVYEAKIRWKADCPVYVNLEKFEEPIRIFREASDAWIGNTPDKFAVHPVATASTRAEGRVFRKALMLNTLVAEEMSNDKDASTIVEIAKNKITKEVNPEWTPEARIGENVLEVIKTLCDRLDIDLNKLIEQQMPHIVSIEKATKQDGNAIMALLNKYKTKGSDSLVIPDSIKKGIE